mgnify:CR=1 FL=1
MEQRLQNKNGFVQNVFDQVYDQYDLMNDFMSLGIHRLWKRNLINMMNPAPNQNLIDVACGTGDIPKLFLNKVNKSSQITCVDPNKGMIKKGKEKLNRFDNLNWIVARARTVRVRLCPWIFQAATMPAAIGTERFLLIGVASLLHAKAIGTPLSYAAIIRE